MRRISECIGLKCVLLLAFLLLPVTASFGSPNPMTGQLLQVEEPTPLRTRLPGVNVTLIDFEGVAVFTPTGPGDVVPVAGSVVSTEFSNVGVVFGKAGVSTGVANVRDSLTPSSGLNSVQGLNAAGLIPGTTMGGGIGDIYFSFVVPGTMTPASTDMVSFTIGDDGGDLDLFQIRSYDLSDALVDLQDLSDTSRFPVTISVAGIHRVEIDFTGDFGYSLDDLMFNDPGAVLAANLDIKPTSCPNPLNPKSQGKVPAAVLGTMDFDVRQIDVATILLEGVAPLRWNLEDVSAPVAPVNPCDCTTDGPDGYMDLTLKFATQDLVSALGPVATGDVLTLTLTGNLLNGTPFEASDCMVVVGLQHEFAGNPEMIPVQDNGEDGRRPIPAGQTDEKAGLRLSTWSQIKARHGK